MHLLVIEDERALCETIVRSLRRLAYSVDYCYDGEKALELLGVECYDLVLLDLNLPKKGWHDGAAHPAADRPRDAGADPLRPQRGGGQGGGGWTRAPTTIWQSLFILPSWRPASAA